MFPWFENVTKIKMVVPNATDDDVFKNKTQATFVVAYCLQLSCS